MRFRRTSDDSRPPFQRNQFREVIDELKQLHQDIGWGKTILLLLVFGFCLLPALIILLPVLLVIYFVGAIIIFGIGVRYLPALFEDLKQEKPDATWIDALKRAALIAASWPMLVLTGAFAFKYVVK